MNSVENIFSLPPPFARVRLSELEQNQLTNINKTVSKGVSKQCNLF